MLDKLGKIVSIGSNLMGMGFGIADRNRNTIKDRVNQARAVGIHPLAALGINPASGPQVESFSNMGQNIKNTLSKDSFLQRKLINSQINETDAKAQYWRSKANEQVSGQSSTAVSGPGSNSALGIAGQNTSISSPPGVQFTDNQIPVSKSLGTTAGTQPIEQQAVTKYGTVYRLPTRETQESISEGSFFTQLKYNLGQIADYLAGYGSVMFPKALRRTEKHLLSDRPRSGGQGKQFRYNVFRGSWVLRPIGKEGSQMWDHEGLWVDTRLPRTRR